MADEYAQVASFATLPRTTRGLPLVLGASPDGSKLVYCNGNSVIIRDVEKPSQCEIYTEHATLTTAAKVSPSGFYAASGDQSGKVRVWDTTQTTHILKAEYPVISGPIRDIAWSDDSKRLAVVGEGRERFGHVFLFDTGTSNGNLSGQSRSMSSIDFRPTRPYRLISGSEDNSVAIFEGPPFKFKTLFHEHSRFVHCVRYRPDGALFASAGADGKVVIFEGGEGAVQGQLVDPACKGAAHGGGVFALSWSPDGQKLLTASGDKTCKIWNVESKTLETTFHFGSAVEDQQLGCVWLKNAIISVSLAGFIYYLDPANPDKHANIVKGHNKPITALAVSDDKRYLFTGDFEGNVTRWDASSGTSERVTPTLHKSQVSGLAIAGNGTLASVGWDDTVAFTQGAFDAIDAVRPASTKLNSQPRGVSTSADGKTTAVACQKSLNVYSGGSQRVSAAINFESTCVALHPDQRLIAVGGQDNKLRIFEVGGGGGDALTEVKQLSHNGAITAVAWSPDGKRLVASDAARKVVPYAADNDYAIIASKDWTFHSARVNCVAWSADSRYVVSGGLDTNLIVWDTEKSGEHPIIIKGAHAMSPVNGVAWLNPTTVVSVGQDSNIKQWSIKL
uniref:Actin-interacting protein 1 n=1 Tax=Plectus sambesii TaxID=2011161 RepID=A0A914VLH2_9BILA